MSSGITIALSTVFVALGLVHLYWVMGGAWGKAAAVPELNDHPAFVPSKALRWSSLFSCCSVHC